MGVSVDEFSRSMYEHASTGDWQEFADEAVKLKWVDVVIGRCQETALIKNPDSNRPSSTPGTRTASSQDEAPASRQDTKQSATATLPRLHPVDCYYLYNPDGYFRAE
jgi:ATP-dependent Clp protease, protease subunit